MKTLRGMGAMIATWLIYLGIPLVGWGVTDLKGFLAASPRGGLAAVTIVFGVAVGVQAMPGMEGIRGGPGQEGKRVLRQTLVRVVIVLFMWAGLIFLPYGDRRDIGAYGSPEALRWIGVILGGLGFRLVFLSGVFLGRQYSADVTIQEDHRLVTAGPYRTLRHPRYLGVLLLAVGESLVFRSLVGLIGSLVLLAVLLFRIRDEEAVMEAEFGEEWRGYCHRTWRLIPFLF
jgi:protein-S-isoprenylcysteine O-methyltransferase Ste14